jgi:hypothetical protein
MSRRSSGKVSVFFERAIFRQTSRGLDSMHRSKNNRLYIRFSNTLSGRLSGGGKAFAAQPAGIADAAGAPASSAW